MRYAPKSDLNLIPSCLRHLGESWSAASGNFSGRYLVGRSPQSDRIRIATAVCVPLMSNLKWAKAPGNVMLSPRLTWLPKDSVANVSQVVSLDKAMLTDRTGRLPRAQLGL